MRNNKRMNEHNGMMKSLWRGAAGLLAFLTLAVAAALLAGASGAGAEPFTIGVLPDTQNYCDNDTLAAVYARETAYLAGQKAAQNVVFVSHVGDVANWASTVTYGRAQAAMDNLAAADIRFGMVPGNHDGSWQWWKDYFGTESTYFKGKSWYVGGPSGGWNSYQYFSGGGVDFLHIGLEYLGSRNASEISDILAWAQGVIDAHPGVPTILSTHSYLTYPSWITEGVYSAQATWENFISQNDEICLVLCGHATYGPEAGANRRVDTNAFGHGVPQVLSDYQSAPTWPGGSQTGGGWVRLMTFDIPAGTIHVRTYSSELNKFSTDPSLTDGSAYARAWAPFNYADNGAGSLRPASDQYSSDFVLDMPYAVYRGLPPALARSPAALAPVVARGETATLDLSVWNAGGGEVAYTATDDAAWLTVVPASGTSAGETDTLQVNVATAGLATGTYSGTITLDGGAASNSPQTVAVTLTVTRHPGDLPVAESFESYANGFALAGTNGWSGDPGSAVVTARTYTAAVPPGVPLPEAAHERVLRSADALARAIRGETGQAVNVDLMVLARRDALPVAFSNNVQTALCVDTNGRLHALHLWHDGAAWTPRWTALSDAPIATDQWVRVSVSMDYDRSPAGDTFFSPRLNGSLCPTAYGCRAPDDPRSPGPWYMCADSPGRGGPGNRKLSAFEIRGETWIDDLVVSTNAFAHTGPEGTNGVPFAWFDRWGLARDPGADGDNDGVPAEDEHAAGTDPTDPESVFRVTDIWTDNGAVFVRFMGNDSGAAAPYIMERATNGLAGGWSVADPAVPRAAAPEPATTWHEPLISGGAIFYRPKTVAGD